MPYGRGMPNLDLTRGPDTQRAAVSWATRLSIFRRDRENCHQRPAVMPSMRIWPRQPTVNSIQMLVVAPPQADARPHRWQRSDVRSRRARVTMLALKGLQ